MIISLELHCFGKHLNRTFAFTEGMNAIRGANEDGKSTMLKGIRYALFGSSALDASIEDIVTWGHNPKELKVSLILKVRDEMFLFTRGPSGAECKHSGGIVTGQKEVTKFAVELLGADAEKASRLMFATQTGLASAMDGGPTALSAYIEDLSGMDLFDILLDEATNKLETGPTTTLDVGIAQLEESLESGEPESPDFSTLDADLKRDNDEMVALKLKVHREIEPAAKEAEEAYYAAVNADTAYNNAVNALKTAKASLEKRKEELVGVTSILLKSDYVTLEAKCGELELARLHDKAEKAYAGFFSLQGLIPEDIWDGDAKSLAEEIAKEDTNAKRMGGVIAVRKADIREAKAQRVNGSTCGFCGQDTSQFPEIARKNAEIDANVAKWTEEIASTEEELRNTNELISAYEHIRTVAQKIKGFWIENKEFVDLDESNTPPFLKWRGEVPGAAPDIKALEKEVNRLAALKKEHEDALDRSRRLTGAIEQLQEQVKSMEASIPSPVDIAPLEQGRDVAKKALSDAAARVRVLETAVLGYAHKRSTMEAEYKRMVDEHASRVKSLEEKRAQRKVLIFNNTLIKKIKAARPVVAAKLWTIVLASVSTMFTQMRGVQSVVERSKDGFLVNGKPASLVSGSTRDILGLGMRVALLRTFIPDCGFMVLDEPMAACDEDRSKEMLAFITSCRFKQVLLVTHESATESVADNVVVL